MALVVHNVALEMISDIKPLIDRIGRRDRPLADQLRRAASSVALNIGEAAQSAAGNRTARFRNAAGSASETRSALQVAAAWGYINDADRLPVDAKLDRVLAMLWRLCHRRP
jgi:four helix bundle protein